jgi:hypothetical protein
MSVSIPEPPPLVAVGPEDEDFHAVDPAHDFTASETNYFGFNIPEHGINAEVYLWAHPRFGVTAGGVFIYQGMKRQALAADYHNYFAYQPMPQSALDYSLPVGLTVKVEAPLERVRLTYADAAADTAFEVVLTGIAPPVGRPGGGHFTQSCKTAGRLVLRGREYAVDGWFSRDHSWAHERPETRRRGPPATWMVGVFGDDLAFHTIGVDELALHPEWREWEPKLPERMPFGWGYMVEDGQIIQLADLRDKFTRRADDGVTPLGYGFELVDVRGRVHKVEGEVKASCPFHWWPNMVAHMGLVEWRMAGRVGHGDAQDIQFNDWVAAHARG